VEDKALMVTVPLGGTAKGAVNVVVPPLGVCGGEKDPQLRPPLHTATQSTPALARSLFTVAETVALPPTINEGGGTWVMTREMRGVCDSLLAELAELDEHAVIPQRAARRSTSCSTVRKMVGRFCLVIRE
jgi:hypothetical protein